MITIKATLENGRLLLREPLPIKSGRFAVSVIISDDLLAPEQPSSSPQTADAPTPPSEASFESLSRHIFIDSTDNAVDWELFFKTER